MSESKTYKGTCFCGAVQFTLSGEPTAMGYCHCESCRSWSAGPVNAFTLWKPDTMKITRGADKIMYAGYFPAGLTLDRIFAELQNVPFSDTVWPKFLRENAARLFGIG